jgi:pyruvate ferredoxin oxidoreductase delta subunit
MNNKFWKTLMPGNVNGDAGNSLKNLTGIMRVGRKPEFNQAACTQCLICWLYCPDNAIIIEKEKVEGINFDYCKGCGICIRECPVNTEDKPLVWIDEKTHGKI